LFTDLKGAAADSALVLAGLTVEEGPAADDPVRLLPGDEPPLRHLPHLGPAPNQQRQPRTLHEKIVSHTSSVPFFSENFGFTK
jgi:hypothetical protein